MICSNCGFSNKPGDEFCGSCGQFLEWTGQQPDATAEPTAEATSESTSTPDEDHSVAPGAADTTAVVPVSAPPPTPPPPPPAGPPPSVTYGGRAPDVICWNCSTRNPAGRSFCIKCGERLTTDTPVAAAAVAGAGSGGSSRGRLIGAAILGLALLLVVAIGAYALLGGGRAGPTATPGPTFIADSSATPASSAGATQTAGASAPASALANESAAPATGSPAVTDSPLLPTTPPTAQPTAPPTAPPTAKPTPKPTRPPTPTPAPTPAPTPLNCDAATSYPKSFTLDETTTKTVPSTRGWCVGKVIFHNTTIDGASVKLKLYLNNAQAFYDFPADFQYGWLEVTVDASGDYPAPVYYPPSYMENGLEPSTTISFKVEECTAAPGFCGGSVTIYYEGGPPPP